MGPKAVQGVGAEKEATFLSSPGLWDVNERRGK
jgi:hypothetical protein